MLGVLDAVVELGDQAVAKVEAGVADFVGVDIVRVVVLPVRLSLAGEPVIADDSRTVGIGYRGIEAVTEVLAQRGGEVIGVALIRVLHHDDGGIELVVATRIGGTHLARSVGDRLAWAEGEVAVADVVQVLGEHPLDGGLDAPGKVSLEGQVGTPYLRVGEVLRHEVYLSGARDEVSVALGATWVSAEADGAERLVVARVERGALDLDARVGEAIGDPYEGHATSEDTRPPADRVAAVLIYRVAEAEARREEGLDAGEVVVGHFVLASDVAAIELLVLRRTVEEEGSIDTQTVGQAQLVVDLPVVLRVEADLASVELRRPEGSTRHCGVDAGEVVGRGTHFTSRTDGHEVHEARLYDGLTSSRIGDLTIAVLVGAVKVIDEEVAHTEELVMRTEGEGVVTSVEREVVRQGEDVLIQLIGP